MPCLRDPHPNIAIMFGMEILEWWVYTIGGEKFYETFNCLNTIPPCDGQTDSVSMVCAMHRHGLRHA